MEAVVSILSTSFWAVPDFKRLEPVSTSGPTTVSMAISTIFAIAEFGLLAIETVAEPKLFAYSNAPIT